jgi:hypothetical protein
MHYRMEYLGDGIEELLIYVNSTLTITVDIFCTPEGYKCLATNSYKRHESIEGFGKHADRTECVGMAIKELVILMEEFDKSNKYLKRKYGSSQIWA